MKKLIEQDISGKNIPGVGISKGKGPDVGVHRS